MACLGADTPGDPQTVGSHRCKSNPSITISWRTWLNKVPVLQLKIKSLPPGHILMFYWLQWHCLLIGRRFGQENQTWVRKLPWTNHYMWVIYTHPPCWVSFRIKKKSPTLKKRGRGVHFWKNGGWWNDFYIGFGFFVFWDAIDIFFLCFNWCFIDEYVHTCQLYEPCWPSAYDSQVLKPALYPHCIMIWTGCKLVENI